MLGIHTQYKFRHYRPDPETGEDMLIWASDGPGRSEELWVPKGSKADFDIRAGALWTPNELADEGQKDILDVYFDDVAVRTTLYGRLYNDTPVVADSLTDLTGEVTGTGYDPSTQAAFARGTDWSDPTDASPSSTTSGTKTFTAGGTWTAATYIVLSTVASGTAGLLIAFSALSATRTLQNGDSLDTDFTVTLT